MNDYTKPLPVPSAESKPFWEGCKQHELLMQKCQECNRHRFPPSPVCPECLSANWDWTKVSGNGKVHTFGVYHRVYHPGFKDDIPYVLAIVELDEGPRVISNVVHCPPDQVECSMPVKVFFDDVTPDVTLYKFEPA